MTQVLREPLSCAGVANTCGENQSGSCCESLLVPGGAFRRMNNHELAASVSPFKLDKYEVTVARFRTFLTNYDAWRKSGHPKAGEGAHPRIPGSGWDPAWEEQLVAESSAILPKLNCDPKVNTYSEDPGEHDQRPVNCVNWYEAFAFCLWDNGRLPTLAEFSFAAAGGAEQRVYPWSVPSSSTDITPSYASYYGPDNVGGGDCFGDGRVGCELSDIVFAGSKPLGNGKFGHSELSGNLREWLLDYKGQYPTPCVDCANLEKSQFKLLGGGAWNNLPDILKTSEHLEDFPENHYLVIGFRCARDI